MGIVKQQPPEPKQYIKGIDWEAVIAQLHKDPFEFYLIGEFSPGMTAYLRTAKNKALFPAGEKDPMGYIKRHYEITARSVVTGGGRVKIFMKYLP